MENHDLFRLLFGAGHDNRIELSERGEVGFVEWLLEHPSTLDAAIARHRLDYALTSEDTDALGFVTGSQVFREFAGRSLHSALAALAESREHCPVSQKFLSEFETPLPIDGPDGLWQRMSAEGGSIRKAASFVHGTTGLTLPVRLDFHRAPTADHLHNELAQFTMHADGVRCCLQVGMILNYVPRLFAAFSYLLPYFSTSNLSGQFNLCLGDEGIREYALSFCSVIPDFLVPDPIFISTRGYLGERSAFGDARPWHERNNMAYWRGTDTGAFRYNDLADAPRVIVAKLSLMYPDLIDAKITQVEMRPDWEEKKKYYEANDLMGDAHPQSQIIEYQYQIDIDGNTNSWSGLFLKFLTGAPVLKLESEMGFKQWFYHRLIPWVNFVPVKPNGEDLLEKIRWLRSHPDEAAKIGSAGRSTALSISFESSIDQAQQTVRKLASLNQRMKNLS